MSTLVNEDDLRQWCGWDQRGRIEAWLKENRICYTYGKGNKLLTTQAAIDKALTGQSAEANNLASEF